MSSSCAHTWTRPLIPTYINLGELHSKETKCTRLKRSIQATAAAKTTASQRELSLPSLLPFLSPHTTPLWTRSCRYRLSTKTCDGQTLACRLAEPMYGNTIGRHRQLKPSTEHSHVATNEKKRSCIKRTRIFSATPASRQSHQSPDGKFNTPHLLWHLFFFFFNHRWIVFAFTGIQILGLQWSGSIWCDGNDQVSLQSVFWHQPNTRKIISTLSHCPALLWENDKYCGVQSCDSTTREGF